MTRVWRDVILMGSNFENTGRKGGVNTRTARPGPPRARPERSAVGRQDGDREIR